MSMTERKKWPRDYISDDSDFGISCPKCGCKHFETTHSLPYMNNQRKRRKICRNCGRIVTTYESTKPKD